MLSTLLSTREIQIKITMRYHLTPVRMAIVKHSTKNQGWRRCGGMRTLLHWCWKVDWEQPLWRQCVRVLSHFSRVRLFSALWTVACQAPLSLGFSRQDHWSGLPCPPPGDLPHPGTEPESLMFPVLAGGFFTTSAIWEASGWYTAIDNWNKIRTCRKSLKWQLTSLQWCYKSF